MIEIFQATSKYTDEIMDFIDKKWRKGHILSKNKELFLFDFLENDKLNIIIATKDDKIVGFFGFIKYNSDPIPDIAGSFWKVDEEIKEPMLGLKLRNYCIKTIPHNFFAAPGAGIQTKPIYEVIGMNWAMMNHFYIVNPTVKQYQIIKNPEIKQIEHSLNNNVKIDKIIDIEKLKEFNFDNEKIVPKKDFDYIKKRFYSHPVYKYDIYYVEKDKKIKNIFVCRTQEIKNIKILRIVDFYGDLDFIGDIAIFLQKFIVDNDYEYCDFVNYGLDVKSLQDVGFALVDLLFDSTIVPNYFSPFVQKNIPIYCVWDKTDKEFRMFKADGDQDRPN